MLEQDVYILWDAEKRGRIGLAAVVLTVVWTLFCAACYVGGTYGLDGELFKGLKIGQGIFFVWQAGGFFFLAILVGLLRPKLAVGLLGAYLILSSAWLLAIPWNAVWLVELAAFLLWMVCAVKGMRKLIARTAGAEYAAWGISAAAVYAALIPIGFFLGLFRAITPSVVWIAAVSAALPGADGLAPIARVLPRHRARLWPAAVV